MTDANKPTPSARQSKNIWIAIADGRKLAIMKRRFIRVLVTAYRLKWDPSCLWWSRIRVERTCKTSSATKSKRSVSNLGFRELSVTIPLRSETRTLQQETSRSPFPLNLRRLAVQRGHCLIHPWMQMLRVRKGNSKMGSDEGREKRKKRIWV